MKLFINTTNLQKGGSLQVSLSVINELVTHTEHEYHLFLSPQMAAILDMAHLPGNFHFYIFNSNPIKSASSLMNFRKTISKQEKLLNPDFVLTMFGPTLWKPKTPHLVGFANGLYLYDKAKFIQKIWLNTPLKRMLFYFRRSMLLYELKREATLLWTETNYARSELCKALYIPPNKVSVISNTYGHAYDSYHVENTTSYDVFTFLYLSADYPHKNLEIFNKLLPILKARDIKCRFRLTLPDAIFKKRFPSHINDPMLENIGPLSPKEGPEAYSDADALFFPSFIETFSASYPEAMIMKRPIITSDLNFAHDICGDAALYFDPFDPESAADAIEKLISDPHLSQKLVTNGKKRLESFDTAAQRAEKLLNVMKDYLVRSR